MELLAPVAMQGDGGARLALATMFAIMLVSVRPPVSDAPETGG